MDLTLHNDNESIYEESNFGEDLPPTRSIHDLNHISTPSKPSQIELIINKDPNQFENVFNRNAPKETPPKSINSSESAVLVFGYPESISDLVIQHFREFGEFLEKFDNNNKKHSSNSISLNNKKIVPIFVGKNWLKLTFKNSDAASQALLENGIVFNGSILGVIPYSKEAIEKLQKRKLTDEEDFGTNDLKSVKKEPLNNSISSNIDIKDGTKFFLKASDDKVTNKSENSNLTWYEKITKALFGFHEL